MSDPGRIRLLGHELCVSGAPANGAPNRPVTFNRCIFDDPAQLWFIDKHGLTMVSNSAGECITVRGDGPSVGDKVGPVSDSRRRGADI